MCAVAKGWPARIGRRGWAAASIAAAVLFPPLLVHAQSVPEIPGGAALATASVSTPGNVGAPFERVPLLLVGGETLAAEQGMWASLMLEVIPVAALSAVTALNPTSEKAKRCQPLLRCGVVPSRRSGFAPWEEPYGPVSDGAAIYTTVGQQRYFTYPAPSKDRTHASKEDWTWGIGVQGDILPVFQTSASGKRLFFVGELGAGLADDSDVGTYGAQTRLIIGQGGQDGFYAVIAEFGAGTADLDAPLPVVTAALRFELRF